MKIKMLVHLKFDGEYHPVGSFAEVENGFGKSLCKAGHVETFSKGDGPKVLTDINGVGDEIAGALEMLGINSIEALAVVNPEIVADLPGVSANDAKKFVAAAKKLIK